MELYKTWKNSECHGEGSESGTGEWGCQGYAFFMIAEWHKGIPEGFFPAIKTAKMVQSFCFWLTSLSYKNIIDLEDFTIRNGG